ncbi:molybdate ABC transporter permease subunit [Brevibacillus sp. SYP-B805]|uniref:molybdate ABC transporter permease subunit n=1 Tax=Brevibacillus sp. SYP-B805 TaxID=1578199 RepID=UPI0013EB0899|nr:molybdate ABC transporter permease subunit [Brevibacillus sp. SYP-B805]NGQ93934.1 molybdate ABC transporter permease subunit [Brevibacillus sp. SYP-B805]
MNFWSPVVISVQVTLIASVITFILAIICAWRMARRKFRGKLLIETFFLLPLVLPPTVVGFGLLFLMGKNSWLGRLIEWLFGKSIVFTWWAAVVAAAVVAFPLVYQTLKTGFESVDKDLEDAARSMGANEWQVFWYVTFPLAWRFLLSGYMFGFARGIGEFGATLMFAGVIPGKTETIPTAIFMAVESGNMQLATYWVLSIMALSFLLLSFIHKLRSPDE